MHNRTEIRKYIKDMLIDAVPDVGGKVFLNRPNPMFLEKAPCILIYVDGEPASVESGDKYCVHEYERVLALHVDTLNLEGEDFSDYLGGKVEAAFKDDWFLGKRFADYDENSPSGLSRGVSIQTVNTYEVDSESQNVVYGQRISFSIPWIDDAYETKKWPKWDEYYFEIRRTDENATDPVLSAGEGDLWQENS